MAPITRSNTSITVLNNNSTRNTLSRLQAVFNLNYEIEGNDYLIRIQEAVDAQQSIGDGNITHALMILINLQISLNWDLIMIPYATDDLFNIERSNEPWALVYALCNKIIKTYPNFETLTDIANDSDRLLSECQIAGQNYGVMAIGC